MTNREFIGLVGKKQLNTYLIVIHLQIKNKSTKFDSFIHSLRNAQQKSLFFFCKLIL